MNKLFASWGLIFILLAYHAMSHAGVELEDLNGGKIPLASLEGKWVFINYWASWCGPCVDEISELNRFYTANQGDNVVVFAVNFDAPSLAKQRRLAQKFAIQYPSLNPRSLRSLHLDNITVVPVTYVFDPSGHLSTTLYGGQTEKKFRALLRG